MPTTRMVNRGRLAITGVVDYPHGEVFDLVAYALRAIGCPSHTEVHIKGTDYHRCLGMAYQTPPFANTVLGSARALISIRIPRPNNHRLPRYGETYHNRPSRADWPVYDVLSWQDDVVFLAAHEARHIVQFHDRLTCSEIDCERRAKATLRAWRATNP